MAPGVPLAEEAAGIDEDFEVLGDLVRDRARQRGEVALLVRAQGSSCRARPAFPFRVRFPVLKPTRSTAARRMVLGPRPLPKLVLGKGHLELGGHRGRGAILALVEAELGPG